LSSHVEEAPISEVLGEQLIEALKERRDSFRRASVDSAILAVVDITGEASIWNELEVADIETDLNFL
jgi:hypothetical protein